ncbi:MAG: MFS transporter [Armatimonadota bacterium]|nr:MFS transporter [Armatimonadota bacterium]MDR5696647.1 MFS transporter [Armatimonadota bacterium]
MPLTARYQSLLTGNAHFRRVFVGQVISRVGDAVDDVAVLWLVLQVTGSAVAAAVALIAQILPTVLFGLVAGALVDRWNRRQTMITMDVVRAAVVAAIPLLRGAGLLSLPVLYVLVFLLGVASQVFRPALRASLPNLVAPHDLVAANSLLETTRQVAGVIGPGLGGVLIATVGIDTVFYLDALSYLASGALIARATIPQRREGRGSPASLLAEIADGIRYLVRARVVFLLAVLGILSHFYWAAMPLVAPVFSERVLDAGPVGYGTLLSALNAGMATSGLLIGLLPPTVSRGRLVLAGYLGMGLTAGLLAVSQTLVQAAAVLALSGAVSMLTVVPFFALLQQAVPDEFRGRVFATDETLEHAVLPPFYGIVGWLLDAYGARLALAVVAVVLIGVAALGMSRREVREAV